MNRDTIYDIINEERDHQDSFWKDEPMHSPTEWLVFIQRYLTMAIEVATTIPTPKCNPEIMSNIRKITAMGVAAMEQNITPRRIIQE